MWTVRSLQAWSLPWLQQKGIDTPRLDSDLLLADALGVERLALFLDPNRPVVGEELARFKSHLQRRARREPVAYILGRRGFWQQEFTVTSAVLIPRPETELLLETVLDHLPPLSVGDDTLQILELGVGSGALLCSLLLSYPGARGVGVDLSAEALPVAEGNARRLGCLARTTLLAGDLWQPLSALSVGRFAVIVANPPYVTTAELAQLEPEVAVWEPRLALDGGEDGLQVVRRIVQGAGSFLAPGGLLALEIGASQGDAVAALLTEAGLQEVCLRLDYARQPRVVMGRWPEVPEILVS
ncbi:MAG: peptide chain release factor N(5)-glutamine methyltransferase [Magnetococcus sp. MYC-9]